MTGNTESRAAGDGYRLWCADNLAGSDKAEHFAHGLVVRARCRIVFAHNTKIALGVNPPFCLETRGVTMQLTLQEIRMLAKCERNMTSGKQPYIVHSGHRLAVPEEILQHLGIESGQEVSTALMIETIKAVLLKIQQKREEFGGV